MYTEQERKIFGPYFNGAESVFADPIRVQRRLQFALDGETNKVLDQSHSDDPGVKHQAKERLLPAAVYALDMIPFDPSSGAGSLEPEIMAALRSYLEFMDEKKEQGQTPLMSTPVSQAPAPYSTMEPSCLFGATSVEYGSSGPGR